MADDRPTTYSLDEFLAGIAMETGAPVELKIVVLGDLHLELVGASGHEPAAGLAYQARGPGGHPLSGTVDADGRLLHPDVPSGEYEVTIDELNFNAPTVQRGDPPHIRWISKHPRAK